MRKNKNISKKIPNGIRVQTRDNYLYGNKGYQKPNHPDPNDLYRGMIVIDSNRNDEVVLVETTTHNGKFPKGTTGTRIYFKDDEGNRITLGNKKFRFKFRKGKLSIYKVNEIKKKVFRDCEYSRTNRENVHKHVKGRK